MSGHGEIAAEARQGTPLLALAGLVALGAALRLHGLDHQSLWNDELSSLRQFSLPTLAQVLAAVPRDHVPGYWLAMHLWSAWLGTSESILRLPSALFGIATIPAMFALGLRCYGRREALLAAGLTAVAWMPVFYSQEARPYAALLFGVVLSSVWLIDIVRALRAGAAPPRGALVGYVVAASATGYLHFFGLFAVALQAATTAGLLLRRPRALATAAALYGAVLLAYAPFVAGIADIATRAPGWLQPPPVGALWELQRAFFNRSDALAGLVLALWLLSLARGAHALQAGGRGAVAPATPLLIAWLVGPVLVVFAYSHWVEPVFLDRALIIVAPAAYLLLARALTQLPLRRPVVAVIATALLGVLLVDLVVVKDYFARPAKQQFREAAAYLVAHDTPGAPALVLACAWHPFYFDHYLARLGSARRVEQLVETAADATVARQLIAARQPDDVWLLAGHKRPDPALLAVLAEQLPLVETRRLPGATVWHYRRARPPVP